jgi:thymidylate synthase
MYWKGIVTELLWFLRGDTNIKYLVDNDCHIWDGDAYKRYKKEWSKSVPGDGKFKEGEFNSSQPYEASNFTKEQFIEKIKTDDEFTKKWGDLGPIYGKQWRNWKTIYDSNVSGWAGEGEDAIPIYKVLNKHDQIVYTRELSEPERWELYVNNCNRLKTPSIKGSTNKEQMEEYYREYNIPTRAISLMFNQRSVDTFLGLPFNIASYGLLLEIIAKGVNMVPDELIGNLGDVHLYKNHIEQAKEQLTREPKRLPRLEINSGNENWHLLDDVNDMINSLDCDLTFKIKDYQSHSPIKAPLNN